MLGANSALNPPPPRRLGLWAPRETHPGPLLRQPASPSPQGTPVHSGPWNGRDSRPCSGEGTGAPRQGPAPSAQHQHHPWLQPGLLVAIPADAPLPPAHTCPPASRPLVLSQGCTWLTQELSERGVTVSRPRACCEAQVQRPPMVPDSDGSPGGPWLLPQVAQHWWPHHRRPPLRPGLPLAFRRLRDSQGTKASQEHPTHFGAMPP